MMSSANDGSLAMLTAMGFLAAQATEALQICAGNVEQAANYLLSSGSTSSTSGSSPATASAVASSSSFQTIHAPISQYSVENGRSACTCMALMAAQMFLKDPSTDRIDATFLRDAVLQGVAVYNNNNNSQQQTSEHLSAEQVLHLFPGLQMVGSVRQGSLTSPSQNLRALLSDTRQQQQKQPSSSSAASCWYACLITKPPETVLVLLEARGSNAAATSVLVDSHPRPPAHPQAYAQIHASLDSLCHGSLDKLFPATNLGPDIPMLMAEMYNAFDLYVLRYTKNSDE